MEEIPLSPTPYKVFIPAAGLGLRSEKPKGLNKALIALAHKPVISRIIEEIPVNVPLVVALGYEGDKIKQYLECAHPERDISYFYVSDYESKDSGLGLTIWEARQFLQCPFVFWAVDSIVQFREPNHNWIAVDKETKYDYDYKGGIRHYRRVAEQNDGNFKIEEASSRWPKEPIYLYAGVAGIKDWKEFWHLMQHPNGSLKTEFIKAGESAVLNMLSSGLRIHPMQWFDTGNSAALEEAKRRIGSHYIVLPKDDEDIWFVGDRVIKYAADDKFILNRVARASRLDDFVPKIECMTKNMYVYKKVHGHVLSVHSKPETWKKFFRYMDELHQTIREDSDVDMREVCEEFYYWKTKRRVCDFIDQGYSDFQRINGIQMPGIDELLEKVDWELLYEKDFNNFGRFHGDLHPENILVTEDGGFKLLDWRQDFGGNLDIGDFYYDFAKLNHGIIMSHSYVSGQEFDIHSENDIFDETEWKSDVFGVSFDFRMSYNQLKIQKDFKRHIEWNGYCWEKVELLTALIFLNIAPLHHEPYNQLLYALGKSMLYDTICAMKGEE